MNYAQLKAHHFEPVIQSYTTRDTMLYALGLNIGADALDPIGLRHVAEDPPEVVPTMPMTLARLGPWMRDPTVNIDYRRIVVGEVALRLFAPIPPQGTVRGDHRILRVTDKGLGRGALVTVVRELRDLATGQLLAEFEQVTLCRGDGGFARDGRHDPAEPAPPWEPRTSPPQWNLAIQTAANQALVYRLSGDMNPLHSDPALAQQAGFDRPILHGLATMGMAGHALNTAAREAQGAVLGGIRGRLSAPVFPGERLQLEAWLDAEGAFFRLINSAGQEVVSRGRAKFHYMS